MRKWPIANYANDTTPYTPGKNTQDVITSLENCALVLFRCFENNLMKANGDKSFAPKYVDVFHCKHKWRYHKKF